MYDLSSIENIYDLNHKFLLTISANYKDSYVTFELDSSEIKLSNNDLELYSNLFIIYTPDEWSKKNNLSIKDISIYDSAGILKIWRCDYDRCDLKLKVVNNNCEENYLLYNSIIKGNLTKDGINYINKLLKNPKNRINAFGYDGKSSYNDDLKILSDKVDSLSNIVKTLMSQ